MSTLIAFQQEQFMPDFFKLLILTAALSITTAHAVEDCEYAVDLADSHDFEAFHECKGRDSGINQALKELMTLRKEERTTGKSAPVVIKQLDSKLTNSALELLDARYELLRQVSQQCPHGFSVLSEKYLPDRENRLALQLNYRCAT